MNRWHPLPEAVLAAVEKTPSSVLFHNALTKSPSPTSRLFLHPRRILKAWKTADIAPLFAEIEDAVKVGSFVAGYFAYECGPAFEPSVPAPATSRPLAWLGVYDRCHVFDHRRGAFLEDRSEVPVAWDERLEMLEEDDEVPIEVRLGLEPSTFARHISTIHDRIRAGEVYQLNFTFPLHFVTRSGGAGLFRSLIRHQPVEYAAFVHTTPRHHILSFSPELFFRLQEGESRRIVTRPMKGTASRGRTTAEDRARATWLRSDEKNRAENLMIVDLLRNDLGRICRFGSVQTESLFDVERYPTLLQMTSTVCGELPATATYHDVFRALFPCGSVTGAPKVRAMQLIAGLEAEPRGVYTGAIGFFSPQETVFSVAIRTLELEDAVDGTKTGRMGVGSGVVIDSQASEEYEECRLKAAFLGAPAPTADPAPMRTCRLPTIDFRLVETLLWQGGFPRLEFHLDRIADSAAYFDFGCDGDALRAALEQASRALPSRQPHKVRLLLDRAGRIETTAESIPETSLGLQARVARICLASQRTARCDVMLFHKTTHRPSYARALLAAQQAGCDDVVFLNREGEVTETTRANIFLQMSGRLFTPPIDCGLLAGVERRRLLQDRPEIEERVLTLSDLRSAEAVFLTNAVRGLHRAEIVWERSV